MQFKRWSVNPTNKALAAELAEECGIDAFVALIAAGRGYTEPEDLDELISPDIIMADAYELRDMEVAVDIITNAIYAEELIAIYGDYDVDGITATALLYSYLKSRGARVIYAIPDREKDGYGINMMAVDRLHTQNVDLIITVDNGISAVQEIEYAKSLGMKVVVTDHHLPSEDLPKADAVINPHRIDDYSEFKDICGVMVAFKLASALEGKSPEEMLYEFGDLVAIGTVADVMPLVNENRSAVKEGISAIITRGRLGISALLKASGIDIHTLTASKIAYTIAPRLNAAGRMGDAARAVELLLTDDDEMANGLAELLCNENLRRQSLEKQIFSEAVGIVEKKGYKHNRVIVVSGENWHGGVVGIVAARLTEKYGRPSVVLSLADGMAHGSARSVSGFSIYDAVSHCSYLLTKFGGHEMAAGMSLYADSVEDFRRAINEYATDLDRIFPQVKLDCKLNPSALSVDLAEELKQMEPFGVGNPTPLFGIFGLKLEKITPVGQGKHLRLSFSRDGFCFNAMLFGVTPLSFGYEIGSKVDIAVSIDTNEFNGTTSLTVCVKEMRVSDIDYDAVLISIDEYESFKSNYGGNYTEITPNRNDVGAVYKELLNHEMNLDKLTNKFIGTLGPAKALIAAEALCELKICSVSDMDGTRIIKVCNKDIRVNLSDAKVLQNLA